MISECQPRGILRFRTDWSDSECALKKSHVCLDLKINWGLRHQEAGKGKF